MVDTIKSRKWEKKTVEVELRDLCGIQSSCTWICWKYASGERLPLQTRSESCQPTDENWRYSEGKMPMPQELRRDGSS
jgi:hypothetical protein